MTNGLPDRYQDAYQLDDSAWGQGSDGDEEYFGSNIYALNPEFEQNHPVPSWGVGAVRSAWLKIQPTGPRALAMTASAYSRVGGIRAWLYRYDGNDNFSLIDSHEDDTTAATLDGMLETGRLYYVQMGFPTEAVAQELESYNWYATVSVPVLPVVAPPIAAVVRLPFGTSSGGTPGPPLITPPAVAIAFGLRPPNLWSGTLVLSAPEPDATIVSNTPTFMVAVLPDDDDTDYPYAVEIQYADNPAFTGATSLIDNTTVADGGAAIAATSPVPPTTYWRARVIPDGMAASAWSDPQKFTVDASETATSIPVNWTIAANATRYIHLWHFYPPNPDIGDEVTIYGQGFPASGRVRFGDTILPTTVWKRVGATAANQAADTRKIVGEDVTPEHYEVTFVAPNHAVGRGDVLTVERGS